MTIKFSIQLYRKKGICPRLKNGLVAYPGLLTQLALFPLAFRICLVFICLAIIQSTNYLLSICYVLAKPYTRYTMGKLIISQ